MRHSSPAPPSARARRAAQASAGQVRVIRKGGGVLAWLARPDGNRISASMAVRLMELAEELEDDPSARMLSLGGLHGTFCTGFDDDVDPRLVESLAALRLPTVALIGGDALDEGLELAMALDIRVALGSASLGLGQLVRGALPRFGGTQRLARLIGGGEALRMLLTGAPVGGDQALRLKLVSYAARDLTELTRLHRQLTQALTNRAPLAAQLVKEAVLKGFDMTLAQGIRLEEDLYALLQTTTDRAEGVNAFLNRRKPLFKGV